MNAIFTSLELDKEDITSKLICVINEDLCDSSFVISSFISNALRSENTGLIVVSFHRSFEHYNFIGIKSGYNLTNSLQTGNLIHLDITRDTLEIITSLNDLSNVFSDEYLADLVLKIKSRVGELSVKYQKVVLIVDRLSDLINGGCTFETSFLFLQHVRVLSTLFPNLVTIIGSQSVEEDREKNLLKNNLLSVSDYRIVVSPLKTGFSTDVSGCLRYSKRDESKIALWSCEQLHHYKVTDRNIKIFSPGSLTT